MSEKITDAIRASAAIEESLEFRCDRLMSIGKEEMAKAFRRGEIREAQIQALTNAANGDDRRDGESLEDYIARLERELTAMENEQ